MNSKQLVVRDTLINYTETNAEAAKALVFLHGWQSSAQAWSGIVARLAENPVRILALDLPGFGSSPLPKSTWGVGEYSEMVVEFIQKLGLKEVILVGHSFGGRVGIKLAATNADVIEKLVLVDAAGLRNENLVNRLKVLAAKTVKPLFELPIIRNFKTHAYRALGATDLADSGALKETFIKTVNEDLASCLPQIKAPTLLVWGADDTETPVAYGKIMNRLIPNSKLVVLDGAGHFSFIDEPDKFADLIKGQL